MSARAPKQAPRPVGVAADIRRLHAVFLFGFLLVALSAGYWAVVGPDTLLTRDDNPRRVLAANAVQRGAVFGQGDVLLAHTPLTEAGAGARQYPDPAFFGVLGYFSSRYGTGGLEAVFDAPLAGRDRAARWDEALLDGLLYRPVIGTDIRLTLDSTVQGVFRDAFGTHRGAGVVISLPDGEIRALISLPGYDPNTLDTDWETLRADPAAPLFNRVLQGTYQPGSAWQTALLASAIIDGVPLDGEAETDRYDNTARIALADGTVLGCVLPVAAPALILREAYALGCPAPFAALAAARDEAGRRALLDEAAAVLDRAGAATAGTVFAPTAPQPGAGGEYTLFGQGTRRVSVLEMALLAAAIVNDGNTPAPLLLDALRPPGADGWQPAAPPRPTTAVMTIDTARRLQDAMRYTVAEGAAQNAGRPQRDIGGHVGIAYAGARVDTWFIGFTTFGGTEAAAIALVLEGVYDPGLAADIGGTVLDAPALHAFEGEAAP
jgi:peptidoglycan glycosyltransferase